MEAPLRTIRNRDQITAVPIDGSPQRSWEMSHLPPPRGNEIEDLLDILKAWLNGREWRPSPGSRGDIIWEYAERHGFGGVLGALTLSGRMPPGQLSDRGRERYFSNSLQHEKSLRACQALQEAARNLDLPLTIIKGPALIETVYQDSGLRNHADIDVLVPSRRAARKLTEALNLALKAASRRNGLKYRLLQTGRLHTRYLDWEIEFMHPIPWPCDPMFDLLQRHQARSLHVPAVETRVAAPDPSLHLLFLITHMARHLCFRLIWFLDIVVLCRHYRDAIDHRWIVQELDRLQMRNIAAAIARFCREYLDSGFPEIEPGPSGWNTPLQEAMVSADQIQGVISLHHHAGWRRHFTNLLSPARFFLITDPAHHFVNQSSTARLWLVNRLFFGFKLRTRALHRLLDRILILLGRVWPTIFHYYLIQLKITRPHPPGPPAAAPWTTPKNGGI